MRLTIVIPTLNEERALPTSLPPALDAADEVWVSDGGSSDRTRKIARSLGARVVIGPPGRGVQLNRGARACDGEILLFLHADTRLPAGAAGLVRAAIGGGAVGGGFEVRFEPKPSWFRLPDHVANVRARLTGWPLGDHAHFVRRDAFETLGGYPEWPILEDLDFIRRLKRHGRTVVLDAQVTTSARRFLGRGLLRTNATNYLIWTLYFAGVSPMKLAWLYKHIR